MAYSVSVNLQFGPVSDKLFFDLKKESGKVK